MTIRGRMQDAWGRRGHEDEKANGDDGHGGWSAPGGVAADRDEVRRLADDGEFHRRPRPMPTDRM